MPRAKRNTSEEVAELQAFRDGVLALVAKHFGRKRSATPKAVKAAKPAEKWAANGEERV